MQEVSFLKFQFILFILISLLTTATITITAAWGLPKIANAGSTGAAAKSTTGATAGAGQHIYSGIIECQRHWHEDCSYDCNISYCISYLYCFVKFDFDIK